MIKKITDKDKKDWIDFLNSNKKIDDKDIVYKTKISSKSISIDLHGFSLDEANKKIHNFIIHCYNNNTNKITIITGKGSRSKNKDNPYQSENLGILKYSVPEFIKSNNELMKVIKSINQEDIESSSKGSFEIILKSNNKIIK